ncbi:hypothetical protein H0H92_012398 [Tricholoma furcatifolium]|nr:hypothetical protein H0H92_012398 [Tricholoma furcatifolium]
MLDSDSDSEVYERDSQSQFVSKEGDDEVLWEVVEITAEKQNFYKVRWAGVDPQTNKPWAQSWVTKSDCTDDLVHEWKRKKLKKNKKGISAFWSCNEPMTPTSPGSKGRASGASHTPTRVSAASSSTATKRSIRTSNALTISPEKKGKRSRSSALFDDDATEDATAQKSIRPKKRRKISVQKSTSDTDTAYTRSRKGKKSVASESESDTPAKVVSTREEEGGESDNEGSSRRRSVTPTPRDPVRRSPEQDAMYWKYKSGKISTPIKKKAKRSSESVADSPFSSSDEIEEIVPPPPPSPPSPAAQGAELPDATPPPEMYEYVDFDPDPPPQTNGHRVSAHTNGAKDDSYRRGIVPETQSSNNTQPRSQLPAQPLVPQRQPSTPPPEVQPVVELDSDHPSGSERNKTPTKPSRQPTLILPAPPSTPGRSSLIARMKPRTPSSSFISLTDHGADIIYDHKRLEVHQEEEEEELDDVDPVDTQPPRTTENKGARALRTIPQLSPAVFRSHLPPAASTSSHPSHRGTESTAAEESDEAEVQDLVSSIEQFSSPEKAGRKRKIGQPKARSRKGKERAIEEPSEDSATEDEDSSLEEAVRARGRQLAARARAKEVQRQREYNGEPDEGKRKTFSDLISAKARGKEAEKPRSDAWWLQKKVGKQKRVSSEPVEEQPPVRPMTETQIERLRGEEEESTQDLMMEAAGSRPAEEVEMAQDWKLEVLSQEVPAIPEELEPILISQDDELATRPRSKSKSSSHSRHSVQRTRSKENLVLPPTASMPSPTPIESQEQDNAPDFIATLALLNEKSQEIAALREALLAAQAPRPRELELEQELQTVRASLEAAQTSVADSERRVSDALRGKESAEKEREVFRDCYAKASGFATTIREENAELEKQAKIAKEQATTGVEAVKAMYSGRVKALEDDVIMYKRLATFIMEKDVRTNDEVRKRAAEEPELRARCGELAKENRVLKNEIVELRDDLEDKEIRVNYLERQLNMWKNQTTMLNADLNKVKSAQEGVDRVYQCGWRIDDALNVPCEQVFTTYDEFEKHMFSDKHLHNEQVNE